LDDGEANGAAADDEGGACGGDGAARDGVPGYCEGFDEGCSRRIRRVDKVRLLEGVKGGIADSPPRSRGNPSGSGIACFAGTATWSDNPPALPKHHLV
jgi:hypothetical protein